jgi:AbrB family looped-hinge helix DNA binding protein
MHTKVSTKGNVQLPGSLRRRLGIKAGDSLEADVQEGNIVLRPKRKKKKYKTWIGKDPITGMAVLMAEEGAPKLTNEMVAELLADFP